MRMRKAYDQKMSCSRSQYSIKLLNSVYRRLGAKGSYLTLVRVADRILWLRGDDIDSLLQLSFIQWKTPPEFQTSGTYFTKEHKQCLVLFHEKMNKV